MYNICFSILLLGINCFKIIGIVLGDIEFIVILKL